MRKIVVFLFFVLFTTNIQSQWIEQQSGRYDFLRDVQFLDENTGWICGDEYIYKTTNGGDQWVVQYPAITNSLLGIFAVDSMVVYSVGINNTLIKTTNGGENWSVLRHNHMSGIALSQAYFLNRTTGWVAGSITVLKTINGGLTFDSIRTDFLNPLSLHFRNNMEGIMSGVDSAVYKTSNGGYNWTRMVIPGQQSNVFFNQSFIDSTTGWIATNRGRIYKTTDYGETWNLLHNFSLTFSNSLLAVDFADENTGWVYVSPNKIIKTTSGGSSWFDQVLPNSSSNIYSLDAYNNVLVWGAGIQGRIIHTSSGGIVSVSQNSNIIPANFLLEQNYPNPFNPETKIKFHLPASNIVTLKIYNILGQEVKLLINQMLKAGSYEYTFDGGYLRSGVYYYKINAGAYEQTKRMVLLK